MIMKFRGAYAVTGDIIENIINHEKASSDKTDEIMKAIKPLTDSDCAHHITFCSKTEAACLSEASIRAIKSMTLAASDVISYGMHLNRAKHNAFIKIVWNKGNLMRVKYGFKPKDFHITLSALHLNDEEMSHEITAQEALAGSLTERQADHFLYHLLHIKEDHAGAMLLLETWMQDAKFASSEKLLYRLVECLFKLEKYKACVLACLRLLQTIIEESQDVPADSIYSNAVKILKKCALETQASLVMTDAEYTELQEINYDVRRQLYETDFTSCTLVDFINTIDLPCLGTASRLKRAHQRLPIVPQSLPRYFTWVVPGFLAGMSSPRKQADIDLLQRVGIKSVITLTGESPLNTEWFKDREIENQLLPVQNMGPPSIQQVDYFIRMCQRHWNDHKAILCHCGGGLGRAGTMLACYLALWKTGLPSNDEYPIPVMPASEAIQLIRGLRPGSIESASQEAFVGQWVKHRWQQKDKRVPEPQCEPLEILGTPKHHPDKSRVIVLVGASGSGKGSWSSIFLKNWKNTCVINQDSLGSKEACLVKFKESIKKANTTIIVDRCNLRVADRKQWIIPGHETIAVEFLYSPELCKQRVAERHDHETIRPGSGRRIVEEQFGQYEKVSKSEGFDQLYQVRSIHAAEQSIDKLLESMNVFHKFPRTRHLVNLGSATGDDLVLSEKEVDALMSKYNSSQIISEEKVDGANLGISLSGFDLEILSQNRGHYINHETHSQFKKLDDWLNQHRADLLKILFTDKQYPRRYILFGEWLASSHSIAYSKLPDYFIAFDIYDRHHEQFLSRSSVQHRLKGTSIFQVPKLNINITLEILKDKAAIQQLVQQRSSYVDGPIEGVYFRFSDGRFTKDRAKVVRSDFLASSKHWTAGIARKNCINLSK